MMSEDERHIREERDLASEKYYESLLDGNFDVTLEVFINDNPRIGLGIIHNLYKACASKDKEKIVEAANALYFGLETVADNLAYKKTSGERIS